MFGIRKWSILAAAAGMALPGSAIAQQVTLSLDPGLIEAPAFIDTIQIEWYDDVSGAGEDRDRAEAIGRAPLASFGPFRVVDSQTVEMHGVVDGSTPARFAAMYAAYPGLRTLRMIECPGSEDDEANLALARMVRAARIETVVPAGGSVRSGAVELFLAGVRRQADSRAEFAVHSWRDELGREADDLAQDDPIHREYLEFYREMGLSDDNAKQFSALTSSVSFDDALYLAPLQLAAMGMLDVI
jgi:hypothetical protein